MHNYYRDIIERIGEAPKWFDEFGVPRYVAFSPQRLGNIYAIEAALAEISCQACGHLFHVALTNTLARAGFALSDEIRLRRVHYGDPPNIECCDAGPTMNSIMREVLEYWFRDYEVSRNWQRDQIFEGRIGELWLNPADIAAEILDATQSGIDKLLVKCTSRQNRYNLAAQVCSAMLHKGRVLVLYPDNYSIVARKMLEGLVPKTDVGHWNEDRRVSLCSFPQFPSMDIATIRTVVILTGPDARRESEQENLADLSRQLTELSDKIEIEFALSHSRLIIIDPSQVIDAGRIEERASQKPDAV